MRAYSEKQVQPCLHQVYITTVSRLCNNDNTDELYFELSLPASWKDQVAINFAYKKHINGGLSGCPEYIQKKSN